MFAGSPRLPRLINLGMTMMRLRKPTRACNRSLGGLAPSARLIFGLAKLPDSAILGLWLQKAENSAAIWDLFRVIPSFPVASYSCNPRGSPILSRDLHRW